MISKVLYILGQLSDADADWLGSTGRRQRLAPGEVLIARGISLDRIYVVLDGEFSVRAPNHEEIARARIGDLLGELSLLDSNPTSADVIASSEACVLAVERAQIYARMASEPQFAVRFYKALSMLLALRMRATLSRFGAGDAPQTAVDFGVAADDHEAAARRLERMLRMLWGYRDPQR